MRRGFQRFRNIARKFFTTYMMIFICSYAVYELLWDKSPIMPVSYHTLFWVMTLIFPGLAVTYSLVRLRVRQNEILEICRREKYVWNVYLGDKVLDMEDEDVDLQFQDYVQKRVDQYYGNWEFCGYSLLAAVVTFLMTLLIAQQFDIPKDSNAAWALDGSTWAMLVGAAFLGSYAGCLAILLRRYRNFDLRPTAFIQIAFMLIAGTLAGSFCSLIYPAKVTGLLSFTVGYLSAINIEFLSLLLREQFAKLTKIELAKPKPSDLPEMIKNPEVIESLHGISIYSIKELSEADPLRLYLNIPQELSTIVAMIDEAILRANFPTIIKRLNKVHILSFTQLVVRLNPKFERDNTKWVETPVVLNDPHEDNNILEAVKSLVENSYYHFILGIKVNGYRNAYYMNHKLEPGIASEIAQPIAA
jgi:hypothetical protein